MNINNPSYQQLSDSLESLKRQLEVAKIEEKQFWHYSEGPTYTKHVEELESLIENKELELLLLN